MIDHKAKEMGKEACAKVYYANAIGMKVSKEFWSSL